VHKRRGGTVLFASVTILLAFSQPLFGDNHVTSRIDRFRDTLPFPLSPVELTANDAGHSYYPDYLGTGVTNPQLILVVEADSPVLDDPALSAAVPPTVALLLVAPRRAPDAAAQVAAALPDLGPGIPRIFLTRGSSDEWRLSVAGLAAPAWFARAITLSGSHPVSLAQLNAARLGFGRRDPNLRTALTRGLTAARLEVTGPASLQAALVAAERALVDSQRSGRQEVETNYLILPTPDPLVLSEQALVWSIILTVSILLLRAVSRPKRIRLYVRAIRHNLLPLLGLFTALVLSLMATNLVLRVIAGIEGVSPDPLLLAGGKFALGFLVLSALYPFLHIRLRRSSAVYSGASLLLLLLSALFAGAASVIFGAFFVIAFFFGFLFSLARQPWLKAAALAAALLPGGYLLFALAAVSDPSMAEALLRPPFSRELLTAVLLFPLLLMFFRLEALTPRVPLLAIMVMISLISLAFITATIIVESRGTEAVALAVRERFPLEEERGAVGVPTTGEISIRGDGRFDGALQLRLPRTGEVVACAALPCLHVISADSPPPLRLESDLTTILDRHSLRWRVRFGAETGQTVTDVRFLITTDQPMQLYSADLPTAQATGSIGRRFEVVPGPSPPGEVSAGIILRRPETPTAPVAAGPVTVTIEAIAEFAWTAITGPESPGGIISAPIGRDVRVGEYRSEWILLERVEIP
jgi:hypothetical protein